MSKHMNNLRAKHAVTFSEHHTENALETLDAFIAWTKEKQLKSYLEIAKLLYVPPNEAQKILTRAKLPDERIEKRMKEVMRHED